jgi:YD repeat-containing protein
MQRKIEALAAEAALDAESDDSPPAATSVTRRRRAAAAPTTKPMEQMLWDAACSIRGEKDAPKFYDAVGNRIAQASPLGKTTYTYDVADRLLKAGTRTFTYDADGNQTSVTDSFSHAHSVFNFDAANRLVSITGTQSDAFKYDGGRPDRWWLRFRQKAESAPVEPKKPVITSMAGFGLVEPVVTEVAAFDGGLRPQPPGVRSAIPADFK